MASWNLVLYWGADAKDIGPDLLQELRVIRAAPLAEDVRIVALVDGPEFQDAKFLELVADAKPAEVDRDEEPSTADPAVLGELLTLAHRKERVAWAIVLKGHGIGYSGLCSDEGASHALLPVKALAAALKGVAEKRGAKVDVVFLDSCYMAHVEVLDLLGAHAKVIVVSADRLWTKTVCYASVVKTLGTDADPLAAARSIVDDSLRSSGSGEKMTTKCGAGREKGIVAAFDGARVAQVKEALEELGEALAGKLEDAEERKRLVRARSDAEGYAPECGVHPSTLTYRHRDLGDLCRLVMATWPSGDRAHEKASDVADALTAATLGRISAGPDCPHGSGMSVHFPYASRGPNDAYPTVVGNASKWLKFLDAYTARLVSKTIQVDPPSTSTSELPPGMRVTVQTKLTQPNALVTSSAYFSTSPGTQTFLGSIPARLGEDGVIEYEWDGTWPHLVDATHRVPCPARLARAFRNESASGYVVDAPALLRRKLGVDRPRRVELRVVYERIGAHWHGRFLYAAECRESGDRRVVVSPGDRIELVYQRSFSGTDDVVDVPGGEQAMLVAGDDGRFGATWERLQPGRWGVLLYARDQVGDAYLSTPLIQLPIVTLL